MHVAPVTPIADQSLRHKPHLITPRDAVVEIPVRRGRQFLVESSDLLEYGAPDHRSTSSAKHNSSLEKQHLLRYPPLHTIKAYSEMASTTIDLLHSAVDEPQLGLAHKALDLALQLPRKPHIVGIQECEKVTCGGGRS